MIVQEIAGEACEVARPEVFCVDGFEEGLSAEKAI